MVLWAARCFILATIPSHRSTPLRMKINYIQSYKEKIRSRLMYVMGFPYPDFYITLDVWVNKNWFIYREFSDLCINISSHLLYTQ